MADKRIDELEEALTITSNDLFVLEQANTAKKLTGQTMTTFLTALADGHGGISTIEKTASTGENPVIDTYTITFADASTTTFNVTNGVKGNTGATGPQGPKGDNATITSTSVQYQAWGSGVSYPTGTWVDNVPAVGQGNYLWTRTIVNYLDGAQTVSYSVSRMGIDGTGAVSTVNDVQPDGSGNVQLTASDVGALPSSYQAPVTSVNGQTGDVVVSSGVTSVNTKTGTVVLDPSDLGEGDYVESYGETNDWHWVKWHSGRCVMRKQYNLSISVSGSSSAGSLYYSNYISKGLPFAVVDWETSAVLHITSRGFYGWPVNVAFTSSTTIEWSMMRGTAWNGQTLNAIYIYIEGMWK